MRSNVIRIVTIVQIFSCIISLFFFIWNVIGDYDKNWGFWLVVLVSLLILIVLYIIYSNVYLFFGKGNFERFVRHNLIFNLLQFFHWSLIGFTYYFTAGLLFMPVFAYTDHIFFSLQAGSFQIRFMLWFSNSSEIWFGVNLIPILFFTLLSMELKKYKKITSVNSG